MRFFRNVATSIGLLLVVCQPAPAAITGLEQVATGLTAPIFATQAPGQPDRMYVIEKRGNIKIVDMTSKSVIGTFLNIPDTDPQSEGGLVGLTFNPDYSNPGTPGFGKFYVYVTIDNGGVITEGGFHSPYSSHIREYKVSDNNPNAADPTMTREFMTWVKPRGAHNGGWMRFNPVITPGQPQYLYIMSGDGGNQDSEIIGADPYNHAQSIVNETMGKVLRIDVNDNNTTDGHNYDIVPTNPFVGTVGDDEILAYGLRNPWEASFDRLTGDLWIGDVGWTHREEIDVLPANSPGGQNYGWVLREGNIQTPGGTGGPPPPGYVPPVYDYEHAVVGNWGPFQGNAVIGGYIYRGPDPDFQGKYIFCDYLSKEFWMFDPSNAMGTRQNITSAVLGGLNPFGLDADPYYPTSFAEDTVGNLYVVEYDPSTGTNGGLYRILTNNLISGDYNADGNVDDADYGVWKDNFGSTMNLDADGNHNNVVDAADYTVWRDNRGRSVHVPPPGGGSVAVPEPAAVALAGQLLILLLLGIWRRGTLFNRRHMLCGAVCKR